MASSAPAVRPPSPLPMTTTSCTLSVIVESGTAYNLMLQEVICNTFSFYTQRILYEFYLQLENKYVYSCNGGRRDISEYKKMCCNQIVIEVLKKPYRNIFFSIQNAFI